MDLWLGYFQNNWKRGRMYVHVVKENVSEREKGEFYAEDRS